MMNLSLDELRLIAQDRNISDYENKSKEALIKVPPSYILNVRSLKTFLPEIFSLNFPQSCQNSYCAEDI